MGETFYSILDVESDADREAIRAAYRDHVKETHPDVTDRPDAATEFKRITTARDVLLDETERKRYDRLGHDAYVRTHVDESTWTANETGDSATADGTQTDWANDPGATAAASQTRDTTWYRHTQYATGNRYASDRDQTQAGTTGQGTRETRQQTSRTQTTSAETGAGQWARQRAQTAGRHATADETGRERTSRTDGGYHNQGWQHASDMYRRSRARTEPETETSSWSLAGSVLQSGPWAVVHAILVVSALATSWFGFTASANNESVMLFVFSLLMISLVIALSLASALAKLYG